MAESVVTPESGPREKLEAAVIAPHPTRRYRAALFQTYVLFASVGFVVLAVLARTIPYFPIDLRVTQTVQSYNYPVFDQLMRAISWLGFGPQVEIIGAAAIFLLFVIGLRWEAVSAVFAMLGVAVGILFKHIVFRPRPSGTLVHVVNILNTASFPSGHVMVATAFGGFFAFLGYTLFKATWGRTVLLLLFATFISLMGLSRIYLGQHWFSDVMGAYLIGSLWLALSVKVYRWGKPRYFVHQPVAAEIPVSGAVAQH